MKKTLILFLTTTSFFLIFFVFRFFRNHIFAKPIATNLVDNCSFFIDEPGKYALWAQSEGIGTNNLLIESPVILDNYNNELDYRRSFMNMTVTKGRTRKVKLLTFDIRGGNYKLKVINKPFSPIGKFINKSSAPHSPITYIVQKNYSSFAFFLTIWGIILSSFGVLITIFIATGIIPIK